MNTLSRSVLLTLAIISFLLALFAHGYNFHAEENNLLREALHEQKVKNHKANNFYFKPEETIQWLAQRQHKSGYFVPNPDLIDEPSQLNDSSLRATRYSITTLSSINGLSEVSTLATRQFILAHYHDMQTTAGFSLTPQHTASVRPTLDALLTLEALQALDAPELNLHKIEQFILQFQNDDGGFWDPRYPTTNNHSCLKCTSFALRALGIINRHQNKSFKPEFISKTESFLNHSLSQLESTTNQKVDSRLYGNPVEDSYDLFRIFISFWNLYGDAAIPNEHGRAQNNIVQLTRTRRVMDIDQLNQVVHSLYENADGAFKRQSSQLLSSMKATHLLVWMYNHLNGLHYIDSSRITRWILSKRNQPGEYGGDIYNTYSAIGVLTKFNVSTQAGAAPREPEYYKVLPNFLVNLLYSLAFVFLGVHYWLYKQKHEKQTINLEYKVKVDTLTKLYNRHYLEESIEHHIATETDFSLILIDLDFFKNINDTHGHLIGDQVLTEFGQLLKQNIRSTDIAARWGGEEFALLCTNTESRAARLLAEKLRLAIEEHVFANQLKLTASFGISNSLSSSDAHNAFERADAALYQSKSSGRNQVTFY